jgi:hypothetical protein
MKVTEWRSTWRVLKINSYVHNKLQIHIEFYIFKAASTSVHVFWVVTPCIFIYMFIRRRQQLTQKCTICQPASLYHLIVHSTLSESPN